MTQPIFDVVTGDERRDLLERGDAVFDIVWPAFMLNGLVANQYWPILIETFPDYQFVLLEPGSEKIVAVGNSIPLFWDGDTLPDEGWDWAVRTGFDQRKSGIEPNIQCALSITIFPDYLSQGISSYAVKAMIAIGRSKGLKKLIAPVRPNRKSIYPIIPIERYARWRRDDGLPFDPWMRVHARLGAKTMDVCRRAFRIEGTIAQWQEWTGMVFPESGSHIVPGGLVPVEIDVEADKGIYVEPNVWMEHSIE